MQVEFKMLSTINTCLSSKIAVNTIETHNLIARSFVKEYKKGNKNKPCNLWNFKKK